MSENTNGSRFRQQLEAGFAACIGSSAERNDRGRPYNGQDHTDHGARGKTMVEGLTMRDVSDCIIQGFLCCADPDDPVQKRLQSSVFERNKEFIGTKYADRGDWLHDDIYKIDFDKVDPGAVIQNAICMIEHYMGIYPNVPKLRHDQDDEA